jgi:glycosyltransferase involved in cell wall biosynthesis
MLNLWAQPLVYRDRAHLLDAFPDSDVVVATFWTTARRYFPELRRRHAFVSVYFIQDYEALFYPEEYPEIRREVARSYADAEHHVFASRWVAEMVGDRVRGGVVVPTGIDLGTFYPRGNKVSPHPRVVAVAFTDSSKQHRRGFWKTVEAFRRIHEARPDVELVYFGADPDEMPDLPFPYTNAGRIYNHGKVAELISSCHVLLDASPWQGFGLQGLEAMACATVPVLTNVGGIHEYARDGENCLLFPSGDAEAAAGAILRLLDDPALYARLAAAGLRTVPPFSHEIIGARHLDLYRGWFEAKFPERAGGRDDGARRAPGR